MITSINEWKKINENSQAEKDVWWSSNYEKLISAATAYDWDDWMAIMEDDEDAVDAIMDSTGKQKALHLLQLLDIDELNDLIDFE